MSSEQNNITVDNVKFIEVDHVYKAKDGMETMYTYHFKDGTTYSTWVHPHPEFWHLEKDKEKK